MINSFMNIENTESLIKLLTKFAISTILKYDHSSYGEL